MHAESGRFQQTGGWAGPFDKSGRLGEECLASRSRPGSRPATCIRAHGRLSRARNLHPCTPPAASELAASGTAEGPSAGSDPAPHTEPTACRGIKLPANHLTCSWERGGPLGRVHGPEGKEGTEGTGQDRGGKDGRAPRKTRACLAPGSAGRAPGRAPEGGGGGWGGVVSLPPSPWQLVSLVTSRGQVPAGAAAWAPPRRAPAREPRPSRVWKGREEWGAAGVKSDQWGCPAGQ